MYSTHFPSRRRTQIMDLVCDSLKFQRVPTKEAILSLQLVNSSAEWKRFIPNITILFLDGEGCVVLPCRKALSTWYLWKFLQYLYQRSCLVGFKPKSPRRTKTSVHIRWDSAMLHKWGYTSSTTSHDQLYAKTLGGVLFYQPYYLSPYIIYQGFFSNFLLTERSDFIVLSIRPWALSARHQRPVCLCCYNNW